MSENQQITKDEMLALLDAEDLTFEGVPVTQEQIKNLKKLIDILFDKNG